jgi:hypothetical protein
MAMVVEGVYAPVVELAREQGEGENQAPQMTRMLHVDLWRLVRDGVVEPTAMLSYA